MQQTRVSLHEGKRRAEQDRIEKLQLDLENRLRSAKGEELLKALKEEEDDEIVNPHDDKDRNPEDDAYLKETAHILLDWLHLNPVARNQ